MFLFKKKDEKSKKEFKTLTIDEIHEEQLKVFKRVKLFLEENHLNYYICGGTLLGAIRHKGFIPWDDDIDLLMPRPDYEKFENLIKEKQCRINDELIVTSYNLGNSIYPYCKICNKTIEIDTNIENKYENNLFIDIFPMDGVSDNEKERKINYKKIDICIKLLVTAVSKTEKKYNPEDSSLKILLKKIVKSIIKEPILKFLSNRIQKISTQYSFYSTKYVGGVVWGYADKEKLVQSEINNITVEFEGVPVNTFSCYKTYLSNVYGNYMELPPVEKRVVHCLEARKIY